MGLRSMTSDAIEVLDLLQVLELKILPMPTNETFNIISITSAMNGLQGMSDKEPEVRKMVGLLFKKFRYNYSDINQSKLSPVDISNLLIGFKSMIGCVEVDMFMTLIADRWKDQYDGNNGDNDNHDNRFSSLDIALSLYGLQNININQCPSVIIIIRKITNALLHCNCSL